MLHLARALAKRHRTFLRLRSISHATARTFLSPIPRISDEGTPFFSSHRPILESVRWLRFTPILHNSSVIVVPSMGDSITEGTIATLLKKQGETVEEDDIIAQIETDKVTIDVRYTGTVQGKVTEILVKEQDTVAVGQALIKVEQIEGGLKEEAAKMKQEEEAPEVKKETPPPPPPPPEEKEKAPPEEPPSGVKVQLRPEK